MAMRNRLKTDPIPVIRQNRTIALRDVTTMVPGKLTPIAAFNLLRMDAAVGRVNVAFEMAETYELLMNRMFVRLTSWFVPHIAHERFERSTAIFERSFAGRPKTDDDGADTVPYIGTRAYPATAGSHAIYKALGLTATPGKMVNTGYEESYNLIANYVRTQRSKSLEEVELDQTALLPALWGNSAFSDIVPDFDDAMIAGELPLTVVQGRMPIKGLAKQLAAPSPAGTWRGTVTGQADPANADVRILAQDGSARDAIYAEIAQNGIGVSLANIDQARQLIAFAKLREQYEGHKDEWIIEALMSGLEIDDQVWYQPMLLDQKMVDIIQLKRNAMDGASLEEGVANGVGNGSLGINVPANTYGGVVMIMAEAFPEQLYERQADPYFTATSVDDFPDYFKDVTNPMPVVPVKNGEVDVSHTTPEGVFGYARRNWKWASWPTRVGGDLYAPTPSSATTVARRSIYATDVVDPKLSEEFYLTTTLGREVFLSADKDPIKVGLGGRINISGLTVIGEVHESEANYDEVRAAVPPLQPIKP